MPGAPLGLQQALLAAAATRPSCAAVRLDLQRPEAVTAASRAATRHRLAPACPGAMLVWRLVSPGAAGLRLAVSRRLRATVKSSLHVRRNGRPTTALSNPGWCPDGALLPCPTARVAARCRSGARHGIAHIYRPTWSPAPCRRLCPSGPTGWAPLRWAGQPRPHAALTAARAAPARSARACCRR
jgi:hypothetical protein